MIIHIPQTKLKDGQAILFAPIETKNKNISLPKTLWYSFPQEYEQYMLLRGDAFLTGSIITAMALGEGIEIDAPVSPKLISGLIEYQKILEIWFPKQLRQIQIKSSHLEVLSGSNHGQDTASFFTGGVDSSFNLRANLAPRQPIEDMRVKHVIFVHGADIPIGQPEHYNDLTQLFTVSLDKLGVNLIPCATNVRSFTEGLIKWIYCHGAALSSTGLVLQGLLKRLYFGSSYNYRNLIPWGSSPLLDHWLSTESLDIVHYGGSYHRTEKMKVIAAWKPAQEYLRICPASDLTDSVNCERCAKCLGTKAILDMEGVLPSFKSFKRPFRNRDYFRWAWVCRPNSTIPRYVLRQAFIERHWKIVPFALVVSISWIIRYLLNRWMPHRLRMWLRHRYYPLDKNPFYAPNVPDS